MQQVVEPGTNMKCARSRSWLVVHKELGSQNRIKDLECAVIPEKAFVLREENKS